MIAGLEQADAGDVLLDDRNLIDVPARLRNFGVVFQSYSLFPNMSAARNIAYGLECRRWAKQRTQARVKEMLDLVALRDQAEKLPSQMSGGQQQRIALGRALAPDPEVASADIICAGCEVREDLVQKSAAPAAPRHPTIATHDQEVPWRSYRRDERRPN